MNLAFMELYAQATTAAGSNFDKLFVPFRCVAADIYKKEPVVFSKGYLGDAVRASMTFPLMYKPLEVDGQLLFDGGIYNNFPLDVMQNDFKPDYIVGCVVEKHQKPPKQNDVVSQILNMVMNRIDQNIDEKDGIVLDFDLDKFNLFDFSKVDELVKIGYDSTLLQIAHIKNKVTRQQNADLLAQKRQNFKAKFPKLTFQNIKITGVDSLQRTYIERFIHYNDKEISFEDFRRRYFMLLSDSRIQEIIPRAKYNAENGNFDLTLDIDVEAPVIAHVGGNISSSTSNQAYFGLTFQKLSNYALSADLDAQFGKIYNSVGLNGRIDVPASTPFYIKMQGVFHRFSFFKKSRWFYEDDTTFDFDQNELFAKLSMGLPVGMRGRLEGGVGVGLLMDHYRIDMHSSTTNRNNDESRHALRTAFLHYENYTLDNINYPTSGYKYELSAQLFGGKEHFTPMQSKTKTYASKHTWLQFHGQFEYYHKISRKFFLGSYAEAAASFRSFLNNYTATIVQTQAFAPTAHSKTVVNEAFRADKFAAIGVKPIFKINDQLYLRTEAYWFVPFQETARNDDGKAYYKDFSLNSSEFLGEASFVFNIKRISIALFGNYYSTSVSHWNFGLNIGCLMFNEKFAY
jgi:NTE family protein